MKKLLFSVLILFGCSVASAQPVNENKDAKATMLSSTSVEIMNKSECKTTYEITVGTTVIVTQPISKNDKRTYTIPNTDCKEVVTIKPLIFCDPVEWRLTVRCAKGLPVTFTRFSVTIKR